MPTTRKATATNDTPTPADLLRYIEEHGRQQALDTYSLQDSSTATRSAVAGIRRHEAEATRFEALAAAQRRQSEIHHDALADLLNRVG